ncbi:MAG TPA: hypothetical protein VHW23_22690 [Kofleriaceae bacterium]|jgi:hypothetical protein|nr:hypothetical protein [Kofleriaceae bacterium]
MIGRAEVERAILEEEAMVEQLAGLLESGADLAGWPEEVRAALAVALADEAMSRPESWKAVALRRHLFGPETLVPEQIIGSRRPSAVDRMRAERLRTALPARVRYRVATYLLRASR